MTADGTTSGPSPLPQPDTPLGVKVAGLLHEFGPLEFATIVQALDGNSIRLADTLDRLAAAGYIKRSTMPGTFRPAWESTHRWDPGPPYGDEERACSGDIAI